MKSHEFRVIREGRAILSDARCLGANKVVGCGGGEPGGAPLMSLHPSPPLRLSTHATPHHSHMPAQTKCTPLAHGRSHQAQRRLPPSQRPEPRRPPPPLPPPPLHLSRRHSAHTWTSSLQLQLRDHHPRKHFLPSAVTPSRLRQTDPLDRRLTGFVFFFVLIGF